MGSESMPSPNAAAGAEAAPDEAGLAALAGFGGDDGVYRVLVVGDALAGGLGAGMSRMADADTRFEIVNRFNESSGLARPEFYDWPSALSKMLAIRTYDAVVVLLGLNDRQDYRDGVQRFAFRTPEWQRAYEAETDSLLDAAKAAGVKVFWISLPPLADTAFDADMQYVAGLQQARVAAKSGNYIAVRPFFVGPDGKFTDRGPDDTGVDRKLRARDGVSFFKQGNNRFGQLVLGAIKAIEKLPAEPGQAGGALASVAPQAATAQPEADVVQPAAPSGPVFGQQASDGSIISFEATSVKPAVPAQGTDTQAVAAAAPKGPTIAAAKGTAAEQLMTRGVQGATPAGRFDDFRLPPEAP